MNQSTKPSQQVPLALKDQFSEFEDSSRNEFDDNGWSVFTQRINEYVNDLYVGTRRECVTRVNNEMMLKYSGKDVERASMRLDFQRLFGRKHKRYILQIGALIFSLLTGIAANWAFSELAKPAPSPWPWIILIAAFGITIFLSSMSFIKDMEP